MLHLHFRLFKLITFLLLIFLCCSTVKAQTSFAIPTGGSYWVEDASDFNRAAVVISKHLPDGTLDPTYGTNGYSDVVVINYSGGVLLNNGNLLLIGSTTGAYFQDFHAHIVYARIIPTGHLDPSFGNGGIKINNQNDPYYEFVRSIGFTPTGEIMIIIDEEHLSGLPRKYLDVFILNPNDGGTLGAVVTPGVYDPFLNEYDFSFARSIQYINNKIIFTGSYADNDGCGYFPAACTGADFSTWIYNLDGQLDNAFNSSGVIITDFYASYDVAFTATFEGAKLIVGGSSNNPAVGFLNDFAVARYNSDGSLDNSFNGTGKQTVAFGVNVSVKSILVHNGKIILGGVDGTHTYLARLNDDGTLDNNFATQGKATLNFSDNWDYMFVDGTRLMGGFNDKSPAVFIYQLDDPTITFTCPANISVNTDMGKCSAVVNSIDPVFVSTGNISLVNYSLAGATTAMGSGTASGTVFNKGITTVTYTLTTDPAVTCSFHITVQDNEPPVITNAIANPATLWPPNHQMKDVEIIYSLTDNCQATAVLSITSNEPQDPAGDWQVIDAHHIRLRAERAGNGNGRIYTINIIATDAAGNKTTKQVLVKVPHDQAGMNLFTVKVYPNPTTNYFTLTSPAKNLEKLNVRIYDQFGKLVETFYRVSLTGGLKVGAHYAPGIYIAEIDSLAERFLLIKKSGGAEY